MLKNLLLYRFAVFNMAAASLVAYLGSKGYITMALAADPTGIVIAIAAMFAIVWASSALRAWKTAKGLNELKALPCRTNFAGKPWLKRMVKIEHIHSAATWMAYLGLIGTVIGFILALSGVDVSLFASAAGVSQLVPQMIAGMGIAVWTTLVGGLFGLWTEINHQMIRTATFCLAVDEEQMCPKDFDGE